MKILKKALEMFLKFIFTRRDVTNFKTSQIHIQLRHPPVHRHMH